MIPINYKGEIKYVYSKTNELIKRYPYYTNYILNYCLENRLEYFNDNSPIDERSNSILENYNKTIKQI